MKSLRTCNPWSGSETQCTASQYQAWHKAILFKRKIMKDYYEHRRRGKTRLVSGQEELKSRLIVGFWLLVAVVLALAAI